MGNITVFALALALGMMQACLSVPVLGAQGTPANKSGIDESVCSESQMMRVDHLPPFTLIRKNVLERKLSDGTTVRWERLSKEARDSQGRHYVETRIPSSANPDDSFLDDVVVRVEDPVGDAWIGWDVEKQEATITRFKPRNPQPQPQAPMTDKSGRRFSISMVTIGKDGVPIQTERRDENLGVKLVSGTQACGNRDTETFPVGSRMNDKPVTVVREGWFSPELGIQVKSVVEDPGFGVDTWEILGLIRGEPDPDLFRIPEGYRIKQNLLRSPF